MEFTEELYKQHIKQLHSIVNKYKGVYNNPIHGMTRDDALGVANEAFVIALQRFDESKGTKLSTYLNFVVEGTLLKSFRDAYKPMVRFPRTVLDLVYNRGYSNLIGKTKEELVTEFDIPESYAPLVVDYVNNLCIPESLDIPIHNEEGRDVLKHDLIEDTTLPDADEKMELELFLATLDEEEYMLYKRHIVGGESQTAIAEELGTYQMTVSRKVKGIFKKAEHFSKGWLKPARITSKTGGEAFGDTPLPVKYYRQ